MVLGIAQSLERVKEFSHLQIPLTDTEINHKVSGSADFLEVLYTFLEIQSPVSSQMGNFLLW